MYQTMNRSVYNIIDGAQKLAYFMRGAMQYKDILFTMSYVERERAINLVEKRLEEESKNPHPVY
jgi:hypothetical protein